MMMTMVKKDGNRYNMQLLSGNEVLFLKLTHATTIFPFPFTISHSHYDVVDEHGIL